VSRDQPPHIIKKGGLRPIRRELIKELIATGHAVRFAEPSDKDTLRVALKWTKPRIDELVKAPNGREIVVPLTRHQERKTNGKAEIRTKADIVEAWQSRGQPEATPADIISPSSCDTGSDTHAPV
jgi:hypothetical protein